MIYNNDIYGHIGDEEEEESEEELNQRIMDEAKREVALRQDPRFQAAYDTLTSLYAEYDLPLPDEF